jgi:hypothetical protein
MSNSYILLRIDPFIWEDESLNINEKILLNFVFSFTFEGKCCTVPSDWIARRFGWSAKFVNEMIFMMVLRDWLWVENKDDGTRCMSINIPGSVNPCLAEIANYVEINN